ncbi:MAG: Gldg family protein [Gammaproteobacteria bacterium]|nr:Gldg family protein [Gammaproteobacteria bacterium]
MGLRRAANRWLFYALLAACVLLVARVAERYPLRADISVRQANSLSAVARQALGALPAALEITAWVPALAVQRAEVERLLAPYLAHPAAPRLVFVDPVAEPRRARDAGVGRHGELHLRTGARREVVTTASRAALDSALNRLARHGERWIVTLKGHGEVIPDDRPAGLGRLATRLETLGYQVVALDPRQLESLPDNTALLLVAAPAQPYADRVTQLIGDYVDGGGALLWLLGDAPVRLPGMDIALDVLPGRVVDAAAAQYGLASPDHAIVTDYPALLTPPPAMHSVIGRARALDWRERPGWQPVGRLHSSPRSWNETGALTGRVARDPALGERAGPLTVGLALQRRAVDRPPARLLFVGGADWIGNSRIGDAANLALATGLVNWLTGNAALAAPAPANDLDIHWSPLFGGLAAIMLMAVLPLAYLLTGLWLRARRRRA